MTGIVIAVVVAVVITAAVWFLVRRSAAESGTRSPAEGPRTLPAPPVADFHVEGDTATVSFDVPLPEGEIDDVLRDLLAHEAIEVLREKRHHLPIDGVTRVIARGRRGTEWFRVAEVTLTTPGELPPPLMPTILAGLGHERGFDPFEEMSAMLREAPGLSGGTGTDTLGPIGAELRIPAALEAGLRSRGIDPSTADAGALVIGILELTGSTITPRDEDTYEALAAGKRTLIRVVPHREGDHPELDDASIRRFAADFAGSGADRALLISGKYSPFGVYDRERRDPRARYITRERVQHFIDALALG